MNPTLQMAKEMIARMTAVNESPNAESWVRAWAAISERLVVDTITRQCNIEIRNESSDAAEAKLIRVALRRSQGVAKRLDALEGFIRSPYPKREAKRRLDEELGWHREPGESDFRAMDRSAMKGRVNSPPDAILIAREFAAIREDYSILERIAF